LRTVFLEAVVLMFGILAFGRGLDRAPEGTDSLIGINVGQKMPPFTATDQLGHEVSSDTLKGSGGTVLLFFRSADW